MIAVARAASGQWDAAEAAPDVVLTEVRRMMPNAVAWLGPFTGSFWLLHRDRLEEFADAHTLLARVRELAGRPRWSPPLRATAGRDDTQPGAVGTSAARTAGHMTPQRLAPACTHIVPEAGRTQDGPTHTAPTMMRRRPPEPFFPPPNRIRRFLSRCKLLL